MFPAEAARKFGLGDVPLICARELDIAGARRVHPGAGPPETERSRDELHHVYLEGAQRPQGRPARLKRAAVVGIGLIGGSIGLALRRAGWHVTGADADRHRVRTGRWRIGALDAVGD